MTHHAFIITGANRGFGRAISQCIAGRAQELTSVVLVGRDLLPLQETATLIERDNVKTIVVANVCYDSIQDTERTAVAGIQAALSGLEGVTSATLINNAGTTGDLSKKVRDYDFGAKDTYDYIQMYMSDAALRIINISSLLAVEPSPYWGLYATGKAARDMLLKIVALEEGEGRQSPDTTQPTLGDEKTREMYISMKKGHTLISMEDSADLLLDILERDEYESGVHLDYYDARPSPSPLENATSAL